MLNLPDTRGSRPWLLTVAPSGLATIRRQFLSSLPRDRLGGLDDLQKRCAVAETVFAATGGGDLVDRVVGQVAAVLRVSQQHGEASHGGGKLEVGAGLAKLLAAVAHRK